MMEKVSPHSGSQSASQPGLCTFRPPPLYVSAAPTKSALPLFKPNPRRPNRSIAFHCSSVPSSSGALLTPSAVVVAFIRSTAFSKVDFLAAAAVNIFPVSESSSDVSGGGLLEGAAARRSSIASSSPSTFPPASDDDSPALIDDDSRLDWICCCRIPTIVC